MRGRPLIPAAVGVLLAALALPAAASAHAVLERTVPERGANLASAPAAVELTFNEPVEASFGAVRVFDAAGNQVEAGDPIRPGDDAAAIGVALPPDLPDGTYTATYRVISADAHPVSGGFVFSVGEAGAAPRESVSDLLAGSDAGPVTGAAAGVARYLTYAATALVVGGLALALLAFGPAVRAGAWPEADGAFNAALARVLLGAAAVGLLAGAAAIVLQGATAAGTSFWDALDPDVVGEVLETRFGVVWGLREIAWLAIGATVLVARPLRLTGTRLAVLAAPIVFLLIAPALSGHASTQSPTALLAPADVVHVSAMSVWVGGIAAILVCVRAATARLEPADRTRLLAGTLTRFSAMALVAVIALVATGTVQSIVHLEAVSDLWDTGFGRAVAVKIGLVAALVAIGALHRRRLLPELSAAAVEGSPPGTAGRLTRRALTAEAALFAAVLTATAVLVGQTPPDALSEGPQSATAELDGARVDLTVDPALAGSNEVHIYLFDAEDGTQYDELRAVELTATLPAKDVGPIEIEIDKAGPGHYTAADAALGIAGEWTLALSGRLSRFEAPRTNFRIEIE